MKTGQKLIQTRPRPLKHQHNKVVPTLVSCWQHIGGHKRTQTTPTRPTVTHWTKLAKLTSLPKRRSHACYGRRKSRMLPQRWRIIHPQVRTPEVKPDMPPTNIERHLHTHTTQGQAPRGCRTLGASAPTCRYSTTTCAVNQDHLLPGPPPWHTVARSRAVMLHELTTRNPNYLGQWWLQVHVYIIAS
jgi:hypothetical protein